MYSFQLAACKQRDALHGAALLFLEQFILKGPHEHEDGFLSIILQRNLKLEEKHHQVTFAFNFYSDWRVSLISHYVFNNNIYNI